MSCSTLLSIYVFVVLVNNLLNIPKTYPLNTSNKTNNNSDVIITTHPLEITNHRLEVDADSWLIWNE